MLQNNRDFIYRSGISSLLVLHQAIETLLHVVLFVPFDPFYELYNKMMGRLANGGFLNYWFDLEVNPRGFNVKIDKIGPQVLTMEHLQIGFQICLVALAVSAIIFATEIALKSYKWCLPNVKAKVHQKMDKLLKPKLQKYQTRKYAKDAIQNKNCRVVQMTEINSIDRNKAKNKQK